MHHYHNAIHEFFDSAHLAAIVGTTVIDHEHHHHTAAGHVLYCPNNDCAINVFNVNYVPGNLLHLGPADHDHNATDD